MMMASPTTTSAAATTMTKNAAICPSRAPCTREKVTSALLITAALGAMVLAHRERLTPKTTQREMAARRMRDYASSGKPLGPQPTPGVYARHNAVDTPALLPDGTPAEASLSRSLTARGNVRPAAIHDVDRTLEQLRGDDVGLDASTHDSSATQAGEDQ